MPRHPNIRRPQAGSSSDSRTAPQETSYTSNHVDIAPDFLVDSVSDSKPIQVQRIDFSQTDLPEYAGKYAVVLDNLLSPSECAQLLAYAEESAPRGVDDKAWQPALTRSGYNSERLNTDLRKSERIIWDQQELVDRIVNRCMDADDGKIGMDLAAISRDEAVLGPKAAKYQDWTFTRPNERMRFLRYEKGMYFRPHCDGSYESLGDPKTGKPLERTHYTLHLYLNGDGVSGGETTFWKAKYGREMNARVDVQAVMGRVLIFQHRDLVHSGEEVQKGVKYTMRTDLLYKRV